MTSTVAAGRPVGGGARRENAVTRYERRFAAAAGADHASAFAYARTALAAILRATGLERGDEVVLSPLTCKVVPLALLGAGLRPVYADIRKDTLNLDADRVNEATGNNTRAILFQHTYGWSGGAAEVARVAAGRGLPLIEDCAQCLPLAAPGAPGSFGVAAIFSNNPGKPLPAGSGGMAVTEDEALAERVQRERDRLPTRSGGASVALRVENALRNRLPHSLYWPAYELNQHLRGSDRDKPVTREIEREVHDVALRITEADAVEGGRWLDRLETVRRHRAACCTGYASALNDSPGVTKIVMTDPPALYFYPVLVEGKEEVVRRARARGVQLVAWPIRTPIYPVEEETSLRRYGYEPGSCPVAEWVARRLVGLPTDLTTGERNRRAVVRLLCS
ncbi:MAG: DegT/DnrJ/EryC1/StrS family aminotransferase [Gemmatimonadota bacterium]|nr:DegT/DnrJ/EryC1/StrS family aminotransferase [Gemmatimonadota bacterium]